MTNSFAANFHHREVSVRTADNSARESLLADAFPMRNTAERFTNRKSNRHSLREILNSAFEKSSRKDPERNSRKDRNSQKETTETKKEKKASNAEVREELYKGIDRIKSKYGKDLLARNEKLEDKAVANSEVGRLGHHGFHKGRENAALAQRLPDETAKHYASRILKMWMNSPGHRANLLANSKKMGVGISGSLITLAIA